ncbi:hypothetical protein LPB67_14650 [Undibacterium sp. Jales W-56]|uniref:lipopolysaccharide biosynthesis protein n=1 Tax=Undibacterium sp. Jales W-56 TaxID=2897325 RepID=UPI0021D1228E|nr:hypothetical protein [Undibacterium sp. Jales W-56]MCU6435014.1 hypothetical protein [Undibacterium sp. Jales W-56]
MSFTRKFLSSSILSVIDQGMLSALNFAIGMLLIRLVTKEEYGLYGQLYAGGLLAGLVVDSWIAGPLTTVASAVQDATRKALLRHYWIRQIWSTLLMGGLAFAIVALVPLATRNSHIGNWLALAFGAYVIGNGLREYGRTVGFIQSDIVAVLRQDVLYVVLVVISLAGLFSGDYLGLETIFLSLAAASILCAALSAGRLKARTHTPASQQHDAQDEMQKAIAGHQDTISGHGRWAILGVLVGWLSNYSYVYLSGAWLGVAAIADLNASRLLLMPIPLAVAAWSRIARPEASRLMADRNWTGLRKLTLFSIAGIELVVCAYVVVLLLLLPWLEAHVIGSKYSGLDPLVMLWGGYFAINAARWVGTSWLSSGGAFRSLFFLGSVTLAMVLAITSWAIPHWGAAGAIIALMAVELFELCVVWKFILPGLQKKV